LACGFQHHGLQPGETVAIMLPASTDYFAIFLGVVMAGGIPIPIYPPDKGAGDDPPGAHVRHRPTVAGHRFASS